MKKLFFILLIVTLAFSAIGCGGLEDSEESAITINYPQKPLEGIIQWGEGGGTDTLMRPLCSLAEKELGQKITCTNMPGATGSVATQYVYDKITDGYTLLLGAENAPLYKVLGISDLTYEDFDCVYLIGDETVGIVVSKNSPYKNFTQLINAALEEQGKLKLSTTGKGGLPWEVSAFIKSVTGATFNEIPYDSDKEALTAVLNGECDFTVCKLQQGIELSKSGQINYLTMFSKERVEALPDVPAITEDYEGFNEYLPWGPFYGVFVKKNSGPEQYGTLVGVFSIAGKDDSYQKLLAQRCVNFKGYNGEKANQYIKDYSEKTIAALKKAGAINETSK